MVLTDDTTIPLTRLTDVDVLEADVAIGTLYDFADESLPKAGWNYGLIHNDGSLGVHNPSFAFEVLDAAIDALD